MRAMKASSHNGWNLYWVASDGEEDCFVVARNSRSAARVDADYCGFEASDLTVGRVKRIPTPLALAWERRSAREGNRNAWPWYADRWLLRKLGANFRERENLSETLMDDVVYTRGADHSIPPRTIGRRYLNEFRAVKMFTSYGHEDKYSSSRMTLFTLLGICIARCQEIEHLVAHSFILGALAPSERRGNSTISELIQRWKRKTFGQMLRVIDEAYEIEATVRASFQLFLEMRNHLVHGLTTDERFNIHSAWGQDETIAFLTMFELISRSVRQMFRSSFYASINYGNTYLLRGKAEKRHKLNKRQQKQISWFAEFFTPRANAPASSKATSDEGRLTIRPSGPRSAAAELPRQAAASNAGIPDSSASSARFRSSPPA
jgi:hypothetical protein